MTEARSADDINLAAAIAAGDRDAEAAFAARFHARLLYLARNTVRPEDADDLAQEVLTAAIVQLRRGTFRAEGSMGAWLGAILRAKRVDLYRKISREPVRLALQEPPSGDQSLSHLDRIEAPGQDLNTVLEIRQMLGSLPPLDRTILILNQVDRYTTDEIAARLRRPSGTVGRILAQAKQQFRRAAAAGAEESQPGLRLHRGEPT